MPNATPLQLPLAQLAPASSANGFAITPSDSNQLANVTREVYVGVTGDLTVIFSGDSSAVLMKAVPVGRYPWSLKQVKSTGTTASQIVGLY